MVVEVEQVRILVVLHNLALRILVDLELSPMNRRMRE